MANAVTIRIDADAARAISQINATALATGNLDKAGKKAGATWTSTGKTLTNAGASMTRHLTVPIAIAGGAAVKTALDFRTSMNHIQALVGASAKQMEAYRQSILDLAPAVGKGPKELADALYFVTSSGFKGAAALRILTAGARASAAGLGDTQTVVDLVTSAVNAYGEKNLSAAKATDVLTAAVREGKAEPQEMAQAMGRVIPLANAMGVSFGEASGAVAALTLSGLDADEAVTAIRGALTAILKPGADAKKALHGVGISAAELKQEVREKGLQAALLDLNKRFDGNTTAMGRVIPNSRALAGVLALIGPNASKAAGTIRDVNAAVGDTSKAFDKASKSSQFQFNQQLAKLQVTGVKIGTDLIPILISVAGTVGSVAEAFDGLSPTMQKVVVDGALVVAALGPLTSAVGNVAKVVGAMTSAFEASSAATATSAATTGGAFTRLAATIGVTSGALAVTFVGAAAITTGVIYLLATANSTAGESFNRLADDANAAGDAIRGSSVANVDAKSAALDLKEANITLHDAQKRVNTLIKNGKRGTDEYGQALRDLQRAQINHQRAAIRNTDALEAQAAATKKARQAIRSVKDQMTTLSAATVRGTRDSRLSATAVSAAKKGYDDLITSLGGAAKKAEDGTSSQRRTIANMQREASATRALIDALNAIPSQKTVDIFIKQTTQLTTIETNRLKRASGGPVRAGVAYTVGERGQETFVPDTNGTIIPHGKTASARGGDTYYVTIQARDYDAKKLQRDLSKLTVRR